MPVGDAAAQRGPLPPKQVLTSLPLEILFYFGRWYDVFWWFLTLAIFIYKGRQLPYPDKSFAMEFIFLWLYLLVEPVRLFLGSKGNKTEQSGPIVWCFLLSAPVIALHIFYLLFQTYILKLEQFLNAVALGFTALQVLLGLISAIRFQNALKRA
eukprot:jgi/Mesvir1/5981/Mv00735-RA.1